MSSYRRSTDKRECNFGSACYHIDDSSHTSRFSHTETSHPSRSRNMPSHYKSQNPSHRTNFSHPSTSENMLDLSVNEKISFHNLGQVIGIRGVHLQKVEAQAGVVCSTARNSILVSGDSLEKVHHALDLLRRLSVMGAVINIQKIFTNYRLDDTLKFIKPPNRSVIGFGASRHDPYILSSEETKGIGAEIQFSDKIHKSFLATLQMPALQFFAGRIKFQARFGKTVFHNLSDEVCKQPSVAKSLIDHMEKSKDYRSSFCTGTTVMPDLHEELGEPDVKENYNFKTIVKHEGEYYSLNISTSVKNEYSLTCEFVTGKEKKLLVVDHVSADQNKLDLRLSLQSADYLQEDNVLYPYAQQFFETIHLDPTGGALTYQNYPNIFVYTIRHKKRYSYKYENRCRIDIANVEQQDMQSDLLHEFPTGVATVNFDRKKTEVEVSLLAWRKAFQFNECLAGGRIGEQLRSNNPEPWVAEDLLADLEQFIEVSKSVSDLISVI